MYRRDYVESAPQESPSAGATGCLKLFLLALAFLVLAAVTSVVAAAAVFAILFVLWTVLRNIRETTSDSSPQQQPTVLASVEAPTLKTQSASTQNSPTRPALLKSDTTPLPNTEVLMKQVRDLHEQLKNPVKAELRKSRGAGAYDDIFDAGLIELCCRFAALNGVVSPQSALVYLSLMRALHSKTYRGFDAVNGLALMNDYLSRNAVALASPMKKPWLLALVENSDHQLGTSNSGRLATLMYNVAVKAALADGSLSPAEEDALGHLKTVLGFAPEPDSHSLECN